MDPAHGWSAVCQGAVHSGKRELEAQHEGRSDERTAVEVAVAAEVNVIRCRAQHLLMNMRHQYRASLSSTITPTDVRWGILPSITSSKKKKKQLNFQIFTCRKQCVRRSFDRRCGRTPRRLKKTSEWDFLFLLAHTVLRNCSNCFLNEIKYV